MWDVSSAEALGLLLTEHIDILTPGYTRTTRIGKGVLEVGAPVRRTGLRTSVGYFLCFRTYCGPGYGWIRLHGVRNPTAILVLPVLILIRCAERWEWKRKRDMSFLDWLSFNYLVYMAFIHFLLASYLCCSLVCFSCPMRFPVPVRLVFPAILSFRMRSGLAPLAVYTTCSADRLLSSAGEGI